MEISLLFAQIIGPIFIVMGLGVLINRQQIEKMLKDFTDNYALLHITGFFMLVLGLIGLVQHNIWLANWPLLITLVLWSAVVKGSLFILFPQKMICFIDKTNTNKTLYFKGGIGLVFGFYLICVGYF